MAKNSSKTRFWTVLTILNILAMTYPVRAYVQANTSEAQVVGALTMIGAGFLLAITDIVSVMLAYMQ